MRSLLARAIAVLAAALMFSPFVTAQDKTAALPFSARDLSGVWQFAPGGGGQGPGDNFPPLTAWGQAKYDANKPGYGPKAAPGGNDPILKCSPWVFREFCSSSGLSRSFIFPEGF